MAAITYESVMELIQKSTENIDRVSDNLSQRITETNDRLTKQITETNDRLTRSIEQVSRNMDRRNDELNKKISEYGDTLGRLAEEQVKEDLVNKFEKWGIPIHTYTTHLVHMDKKGIFKYEIDILLYNTDYVVAIEVKNQLKKDHIDEHLARIKKIQEHPMSGIEGKIILGGVASMIIPEHLNEYAQSKGLFLIKPSGEMMKIANNKKTFKPKEWRVK